MASGDPVERLRSVIGEIGPMAIALSGGVDSMTLAHVAHQCLGGDGVMFHALSPAVPSDASARVRRHAEAAGWRLEVINAGEMGDPRYLENPVNRCFFCKTNLYARIAGLTDLESVRSVALEGPSRSIAPTRPSAPASSMRTATPISWCSRTRRSHRS